MSPWKPITTEAALGTNTGAASNRYRCAEGKIRMQEINGKMHPIELLED